MNKLPATISDIQQSGEIALITLECAGVYFTAMIIEYEQDYIRKGNSVYMVFKETEVSIGKALSGGLSIRNRFQSVIEQMEKGKLLSEIQLNFNGYTIRSVITTQSCDSLMLQPGEAVEGLLKSTELFIMKHD